MPKTYHFHIARAWFLINLFVSLYPPLYWEVGNRHELILGLPATFIYFVVICISITLSILYAYWEESAREGWTSC